MSNPLSGRFLHLSRIMIAVGVFILTMILFGFLADKLVATFFDLGTADLLAKKAEDYNHQERVALKFFQTISAFSFVAASFIITQIYRTQFLDFTKLTKRPKPTHIGLVVLYILAMIPLISFLLTWNQGLSLPDDVAKEFHELEAKSDNLYRVFLDLNSGRYFIYNLFLMALLPAVGEELFFRGILQKVFIDWSKNAHWGIVLTSIFFALLHAQPFKVVPMIFLAITMGYLFYYSGSLWVPILFHFVNNATVVVVDRLQDLGMESALLEDSYAFPHYVVGIAALGYIALHALHRKTRVEYVTE